MRPTFRTPRKGDGSFTARHALIALAVVSMGFSAMYWWSVQTVLTGHWPIALAYTAILTFAPPALMSFLIPWSRATLMRAQQQALKGFANLTVAEREELADAFVALVRGIDQTLGEIAYSVKQVSGATLPFRSLADNDEVRTYLDFIAESLAMPMIPESDHEDHAATSRPTSPNAEPPSPAPVPEPTQHAMF